ncbi:MAG: DNA polymerase III subunit beta [Candidatus Glassbacteria bacterium]|nr:DNA polymerase III subunit beta [Candidatus Glassbacteria bacterium]
MKISVVKNNLLHAVSALSPIVPTKSTMPVLYNILLEAVQGDGGSLKMIATDLDISLSHSIKATVEKPGAVTIPAKKLGEILRELPDSPVSIEQVDEKVKIVCAKSSFILSSLPMSDFPVFPTKSFEGAFKVENRLLRKLVNATSYATGRDEERQILKGLLWEIRPDETAMVSTNGHRLAKMTVSAELKVEKAQNVVVPPKALEMVEKLCSEDGEVEVVIDENHLGIREKETIIFSRLFEGNYPNYEQVIPYHNNEIAIVDAEKMNEALRRMLILANTVTHRVKLKFSENSINLSVKTEDLGEGEETIDADYQGESLEIYFNGSYLIDMLKYNESDQVKICMQTGESGILAVPANESENQRYLNVIMPLKVTE